MNITIRFIEHLKINTVLNSTSYKTRAHIIMIKALSVSFILLLSLANTSHAELLKSGFYVEYDVSYNGMDLGVSKRRLTVNSNQLATYEATTIPEGFAALLIKEIINETSKLKITREQIQPNQYTESKNKKGTIEKYQLSFDWKKNKLNNSYSKTIDDLKTNTHDLLSFQLNIMQDMQQNKKNMHYRIATKRHTRDYNLKVIEKENIETALGEFDVIKLSTKITQGKSQFTFWCAPSLEYLPIKIQKTNDKGDLFSFTLRTFSVQK